MQNFRETESGLVGRIAALQDKSSFKELHWEGSFEEYLKIVRDNPRVTRTAFQRIYDMILSHGKTEYIDNKKKLIRYHFFHDEHFGGRDAVFGLDVPLMRLVNVFKSAALSYGTEKRVILLHGPVGSSKSTIARSLKKGVERYSARPEGSVYTFDWYLDNVRADGTQYREHMSCPMKDEKNQDSSELTGDINYRKIAEYGSDSDPRAFNFDGEFHIANRGIIEFIEVLKLDVAFLYDLLGASQEHKIKPKKFAQTDIDEVIIGHTNEPEYKRLQNNEFMEALRDRTVKIDVPYVTRLREEIKIYEKDFNPNKVKGKHIAPHTIETAAMWAVLTRLVTPKHANLTLLQKLKLYNGKTLPGFTEDNVVELKREATAEGMHGISPRYIQDKISNALVAHPAESCVNPFMVLHELETGLRHHSLITSQEQHTHYKELLSVVKEEYEDVVKNEVQRAIAADEDALQRLCSNYIDNVKAYTQREKVRNRYTGNYEEPDERLMRSVEEKIDIPEGRKDDFRREIMNYIGALAIDGKKFDYKTNERLQKALELKLFEDQKDTIKLTSLVAGIPDKDTQEKIDIVKSRLVKGYGYCDTCRNDVLSFVASIFARGSRKE